MTDSDKGKNSRKIKAVGKMKEIMTTYYIDAKSASQTGKKVAWITSGGPVEPLIAMDVIPVYPENYGAMIGASKMGGDLCEKAEELGYSGDLCSYARADIVCSMVDGGPIGGLPKPDMLICCNNICGTVLKWYEIQARHYDVPLFILDTPICSQVLPNQDAVRASRPFFLCCRLYGNSGTTTVTLLAPAPITASMVVKRTIR